MQKRRRRRSMFNADAEAEIVKLGMKGVSATVIRAELLKTYEPGEIPQERAIENRLAALRPPDDPSAPWTIADAKGGDAALVLPVLGTVIEGTEGRTVRLSRDLTEWVIRLRRAAPDLPLWNVYMFARLYLRATQRGDSTEALDQLLALAPWRDPERMSPRRLVALAPKIADLPAGLAMSAELRSVLLREASAPRPEPRRGRTRSPRKAVKK